MKKLFLLPLILLPCTVFAQSAQNGIGIDTGRAHMKFTYVEQMPEPTFDMNTYLTKHIVYPADALKAGIQGRVTLHFLVASTGAISDIEVVRSLYPSLDSEAVHIFKAMPAWKPGKQNGHSADVYYIKPVTFTLPGNK